MLPVALLLGIAATLAPAPGAAAAGGPVAVAVVVPITARSGGDGLLDAAELELQTSPAGVLSRELDAALATPATIALDPMILASIRVLGSTAPDSALAWVDRLAAAPNPVFLLSYADADLSAFARAGALDLAQPLGFDFALADGAFDPAPTSTPTATPDPTPSPTPADGEPLPHPTTGELLAWPDALGPIAWPSEGSAAGGDIARYQAAGYSAVLLSSGNVSETSGALADISGMRVVVADSAASELLREASSSLDPVTRTATVDRLRAALDGLGAAHPGRSVVLTLGRTDDESTVGLDDALTALSASGSVDLVGLSDVLAGSAEAASVVDGTPSTAVERAAAFASTERAESLFSSILADPLALTAPRRLALLDLFAVASTADAAWADRADEFQDESDAILGAVTISDPGSVLVTSSSTTLPVRIENRLDFPVTVRVDAQPQRPLLRVESPAEVTIEPGSSKTVRLEAQAITNGRVVVNVTISSPVNGVQIGAAQHIPVDLQAQWETVGLIVGIVVVLVFALGIVRNVVVRRRRAARERAGRAER